MGSNPIRVAEDLEYGYTLLSTSYPSSLAWCCPAYLLAVVLVPLTLNVGNPPASAALSLPAWIALLAQSGTATLKTFIWA